MKKFIAVLLVAFAFLITTNVVGAQAATAQVQTAAPASVAQVAPQHIAPALVAPGKAVTAPFNLAGGGGGIKPAWLYTSCYWAMNGYYYCWRYSCTYFERVALGCYNGWYRVTTVKYV